VLERSRESVRSPSTVNGTIASSTVTDAIVRSSACGFVTRISISPGWNSTRRTSNSSAGGAEAPSRSTTDEPVVTNSPTTIARSSTGTSAARRRPRESRPPVAVRASISRRR
jgi:hypothetical protein